MHGFEFNTSSSIELETIGPGEGAGDVNAPPAPSFDSQGMSDELMSDKQRGIESALGGISFFASAFCACPKNVSVSMSTESELSAKYCDDMLLRWDRGTYSRAVAADV